MGAFVLLTAYGFLIFAMQYYTYSQTHKESTYYAVFDEINNINVGADIKISGVRVGQLLQKNIDIETFQTKITFTVDSQYHLPIDTQIMVQSDGLLGTNYISIVPGRAQKTLQEKAIIRNVKNIVPLEELIGKAIFIINEVAQ